jgi:hypothetical protein
MRGLTVLLALLAIDVFAGDAFAKGKIWLAQTFVTTTCMMTCNSTYANCQASCLSTGTQPNGTAVTRLTDPNANATCISQCTNQQLQCQVTCARISPSQ